MVTTEQQWIKVRGLIHTGRYADARRLLLTMNDPKARVWLKKLASMSQHESKSFTTKLLVTLLLLFLWIIPGLIALAVFAPEAKQHPNAPGAKALIFLNRFSFAFIVIAILLPLAWFAVRLFTL